jgi:hypothetical protein
MAPLHRPNHSPAVCDECQTAHDRPLNICAGPACSYRLCKSCADNPTRQCAECRKDVERHAAFDAAWNARERDWFICILLSGASVGGARLPRVGG